MPKNKILSHYLSDTYDKEKNYNSICDKIKSQEIKRKKLLNVAATILVIMLVSSVGTGIYAKRKLDLYYQEFENRKVGHGDAVDLAIENGLEEKLDMEYLYQDGIGVKIDSILLSNDYFKMNVNFQFEDYSNLDTVNMGFSYAIYDENNNIYYIHERYVPKKSNKDYKQYKKLLSKELNLTKYFWGDLPKELAFTSIPPYCISSKEGNLIFETNFNTITGFPKTKKLFIRIFNPGYAYTEYFYYIKPITKDTIGYPIDVEDHRLSESEWQFEINIPDSLYNAKIISLQFNENIKEFELEKAEISDTGLLINLKLSDGYSYELTDTDAFEVIDGHGEKIINSSARFDDRNYSMRYDISKNDLDDGIYFHINIPELNLDKTVQLIEK